MIRYSNFVLLFLLFFVQTLELKAQQRDRASRLRKAAIEQARSTDVGALGLTITNYGTLGDAFVVQPQKDLPSAEYPLGSGIEHMFDGGLWVGAKTSLGQLLVTTGAVDVSSAATRVTSGFEFTNTADPADKLLERSTIIESPFFSLNAISHQDFVGNFADTNKTIPVVGLDPNEWETIADHNPLGIAVHLETYAWNFPFADAFVILNYRIRNVRADRTPLEDIYVGIWSDLVVRNVNVAGSKNADFYSHVASGYIDSLQMAYAFDYDGDPGFTDEGLYIALKLIGATAQPTDDVYQFKTRYNTWFFRNNDDPFFFSPTTDSWNGPIQGRYQKMSIDSSITANDIVPLLGGPGNFMTLITTGPFDSLAWGLGEDLNGNWILDYEYDATTGELIFTEDANGNGYLDSGINVVIAVVAASKAGTDDRREDTMASKANLFTNASWATRAYDGEDKNKNNILDEGEDIINPGILDRYLLPTPPLSPKVKVIPGDGEVDIYWNNKSKFSVDLLSGEKDFQGYRVYRTRVGSDGPGGNLLGTFSQILQVDKIDSIGYDTGFKVVELKEPVVFIDNNPVIFLGDTNIVSNGDTIHYFILEDYIIVESLEDTTVYQYWIKDRNLNNGWQYAYAVTAFDKGDEANNLGSLETSKRPTTVNVFPGSAPTTVRTDSKVGVYPNPYRVNARWDGSLERDRKLYFFDLPAECEIRIYTMTGDLVDRIEHSAATYAGEDIQWFESFATGTPKFSGGEHAWNLVSKDDQAIATGLYIYTVKDHSNGNIQRGKFLVIK